MQKFNGINRRRALQGLVCRGLVIAVAGGVTQSAEAAELLITPRQAEGPFYPVKLPLDSDNDLVKVDGRGKTAAGQVAHLSGRVLDPRGQPIKRARVEIWQCDARGHYHHRGDGNRADPNFQGFGHTFSDYQGRYGFRTIKPVAYPGRPPHIHLAVLGKSFPRFVSQIYLQDHPLNERDFLFNAVSHETAKQALLVNFKPADSVEAGAVAGTFDIVLRI
jgi:protocatechuate 3,4-dioxygenase beta subunit